MGGRLDGGGIGVGSYEDHDRMCFVEMLNQKNGGII